MNQPCMADSVLRPLRPCHLDVTVDLVPPCIPSIHLLAGEQLQLALRGKHRDDAVSDFIGLDTVGPTQF